MITKRDVVLVVGAGASAVYGFPSGCELKKDITRELADTNGDMARTMNEIVPNCPNVQHFAERLEQSARTSIDAYLQPSHIEPFRNLGRAAVAYELLRKERHVLEGLDVPKLIDPSYESAEVYDRVDWMAYLFNRMLDEFDDPEDLTRNRVTVITFNFDTLLEHRWKKVIKANCPQLDREQVASLAKRSLKVIHLNGSLDPEAFFEHFRHTARPVQQAIREFGDGVSPMAAKFYAQGIGFFHDDYEATGRIDVYRDLEKRVMDAMRENAIVAFLGFGFHPMNVGRLCAFEVNNVRFFATGKGLAKGQRTECEKTVLGEHGHRHGQTFKFSEGENGCKEMLLHYGVLADLPHNAI